ncbi:beta-aspartyl-peptidase [Nonlabens agnitus]|uniref:Isoaspartyl dipeptidase n=1 Tax=Nonlabens agnitus TaxID=870484 RepID=A0A2S9WRY8_9FLAO|nr:beta-aspartyl-peptidase [Nonlabens agnitus]PRP66241.1 beta-aspartyl-peptidase [Nonlabens agnitus]
MLTLIKNADLYAPKHLGKNDILIAGEKVIAIDSNLNRFENDAKVIDAKSKMVTPGFIDQHIHITGAGGKHGFASMTPEVSLSDLIKCGTTTVVGLSGTDGTTRDIRSLYAKARALEQEGITAYLLCGYYGIDSLTITESIQSDMVFIDQVVGCKIAISDIRSSYPTALELLRKLREVRVGGFTANKKGILHVHLGNLDSGMDILFELVNHYKFPIQHISPTHVGRSKKLFDQAIAFAKAGGSIDITTGASQYTEPHKSVLYALEEGVSMDLMTFSSDGHAGLTRSDENGNYLGDKIAPFNTNFEQVVKLIQTGKVTAEEALKLITSSPAKNLGLELKGHLAVGSDADLCFLDDNLKLTDVFARGKQMMKDNEVIIKGNFEQ